MRFILKSAFWLGLIAFLIPLGGEPKETSANLTLFGAIAGAQQAVADMTGFCERAPQACETGREFAVFAGERIGDGIAMAYGLVEGRIEERKAEPAPSVAALPAAAPTDPVTTGAVLPGPAPYVPPKRTIAVVHSAPTPAPAQPAATPFAPRALAIPRPAPRG